MQINWLLLPYVLKSLLCEINEQYVSIKNKINGHNALSRFIITTLHKILPLFRQRQNINKDHTRYKMIP